MLDAISEEYPLMRALLYGRTKMGIEDVPKYNIVLLSKYARAEEVCLNVVERSIRI